MTGILTYVCVLNADLSWFTTTFPVWDTPAMVDY